MSDLDKPYVITSPAMALTEEERKAYDVSMFAEGMRSRMDRKSFVLAEALRDEDWITAMWAAEDIAATTKWLLDNPEHKTYKQVYGHHFGVPAEEKS